MKKNYHLTLWSQLATIPFLIVMVVILMSALNNYDTTTGQNDLVKVQETVEKYAIQCYASEGSYPPDLQYLKDNYGLILDTSRYTYEYDIFASNIMPDIYVHNKLVK